MSLLTVEQAAERVGITVDELLTSRARGLAPGTLGFRQHPAHELVWRSEDLPKLKKGSRVEGDRHCEICGFVARSPGGLAAHQRAKH